MELQYKLDQLLKRVEKPGRYIGGEVHAAVKEPSQVDADFAFAFPDIYEIGMSYLGLQILYHVLNKHENIYCQRVFAAGSGYGAAYARGKYAARDFRDENSGQRNGYFRLYAAI